MIKNYMPTYSRNALRYIPTGDDDLPRAFDECFLMARRGKTDTMDEHRFEINATENLKQLVFEVVTEDYHPTCGKAFITYHPVIREIFAAPFRDRVVHHFLYAVNGFWWDDQFIYDSYSCRMGKGTLFGIERVQHFMNKATQGGSKEAIVVKLDISGYFMSMPRPILYQKVLDGLEKQFPHCGYLYELCRYLWHEIIFDDPVDCVRLAGNKHNWDDLPKNKSLFNQPDLQGIVIGNLTSQLLSNILLNDFDHKMRFEYGIPFYGRYVDDMIMVIPVNDFPRVFKLIENEFPTELAKIGLKLHPHKMYIQPVVKGVPFLGQFVHQYYTTPSKRIKGNYYRTAKEVVMGLKDPEAIISYHGMGKHTKQKKLEAKIFKEMGWEYIW
ncbi:MAG: RNA-directed DNA polymerase [Candidatus Saccharibacteria bacterium]|nr:RNA-directed DNA polymerase [Candidatus Saccharibacteria bacterium]